MEKLKNQKLQSLKKTLIQIQKMQKNLPKKHQTRLWIVFTIRILVKT